MSAVDREQEVATRIKSLRLMTTDRGMDAGEVAAALGEAKDSVRACLASLAKRRDIEELEAGRWRLAPHLRSATTLFARVAGLIEPGEWSTYGEVYEASQGTRGSGQAVARAATSQPTFPNPHRVLLKGGLVPKSWRDFSGNGPAHCRRLLESEGLVFDSKGAADTLHRVAAMELQRRWDADPERVLPPSTPKLGAPRPPRNEDD